MTHEETRFLIDGMTWSFSRINSFTQCPYQWKLQYLDVEDKTGSFYAEFGSLMHYVLEQYLKGVVSKEMLPDVYQTFWDDYIKHDLTDKDGGIEFEKESEYYDQGIDYLTNQLPDFSKYDILGVERHEVVKLPGTDYEIQGYIDALLKDKKTGEITILDHKSNTMKFRKDGKPYKADEHKWKDFQRQLYLYSIPVIEQYGKVDYLAWNMFRLGIVKQIPWVKENYDEAIHWAINSIHQIEDETDWNPTPNYFYCKNLCDFRETCQYNQPPSRDNDYFDDDFYGTDDWMN